MAGNPKSVTEIPTIDVVMLVLEAPSGTYALDSASQIEVEPQMEEEDAVKLVIKGKLKAQKAAVSTLTGTQITLTDNLFIPEVVKILQGGTIKYWTSAEKTEESESPSEFGISSYTPPTTGSGEKGEVFKLHAYSAQYDTSGQIVQYEKITYPNCQGTPVAFNSEDGAFRAPEYTINSAPKTDEAPYEIHYVDELPTIDEE